MKYYDVTALDHTGVEVSRNTDVTGGLKACRKLARDMLKEHADAVVVYIELDGELVADVFRK